MALACVLLCLLTACIRFSVRSKSRTVSTAKTGIALAGAAAVAARLGEIRELFVGAWRSLPGRPDEPSGAGAYALADLQALLADTEGRLLTAMAKLERPVLAGSFRDLVEEIRLDLESSARRAALRRPPTVVVAALETGDAAPARPAQASNEPRVETARADALLDRLLSWLDSTLERAETEDLEVDLCLRSEPVDGTKLWLRPPYHPDDEISGSTNRRLPAVARGRYVYRALREGYGEVDCTGEVDTPGSRCGRLDLMRFDRPMVVCQLLQASGPAVIDCEVVEEPEGEASCAGGSA